MNLWDGSKPWLTPAESIKGDAPVCSHHADPGTALASGKLLLGLLIAALVWAALQILSKTVFRRQPWRSLLLSSSLSVCSTVLAIALNTWLFQLIPVQAKLSILELESLRSFLLACGAAWSIRR